MTHTERNNLSVPATAARWWLDSGIQDADGGVARYYRVDLKQNAAVSTEITGYAVSALLWLHAATGEKRALEHAERAGRFLTGKAWDSEYRAMPFEIAPAGERRTYFFDCGIIARGLAALWRAMGEPEFLEVARGCMGSMARDFAVGLEYHPILALPSKQPTARDARWSRQPGCYQLKAALAWLELSEHRRSYDRVLNYALRTHEAFLSGEPEPQRVVDRLHAYCYFLEGLLPSVERPECAAALREGIERVGRLAREHAAALERSDVYAQSLRLRVFAAALGVATLDRTAAECEAAAVRSFQDPESGGFRFGRKGNELLPHVNPASTAFCAQALELWRQWQAGDFTADWRKLI